MGSALKVKTLGQNFLLMPLKGAVSANGLTCF